MSDAPHRPAPTERTRHVVLAFLRSDGPATRDDIVRATGLARATVATAVSELVRDGVLCAERSSSAAPRGRRPELFRLSRPAGHLVAIDLGHAHVSIAVATGAGEILDTCRADRAVDEDPHGALRSAIVLARQMADDAGEAVAAVAMVAAQPVDARRGTVQPTAFLTQWHDLQLTAAAREAFDAPIVIENDANAGALAEHAGEGVTAFVKVSTGVGMGVVVDGRIMRGPTGDAGEIGHLVMRPEGALCACGNRGCLETVASLTSIREALTPVHGAVGVHRLADLLALGDVSCRRAMRDAGAVIGMALAPMVAAMQVTQITFGGAPRLPFDDLVAGVRDRIVADVHREIAATLVVRAATNTDDAPLRGGLLLAAEAASAAVR